MTRRNKGAGRGTQDHKRGEDSHWLWGSHAVRAALVNPKRRSRKLLAVGADAGLRALAAGAKVAIESVDPAGLSRVLPREAVHQGLALLADPLEELDVQDAIRPPPTRAG